MRKIYSIKKSIQFVLILLGGLATAQVYNLGVGYTANDVSDDGSVVALSTNTANYMWTEAGGVVMINQMENDYPNAGNPSVSADGTIISATATNPDNNYNEMGKYDVATGTWTYLGGIGGPIDGSISSAWSMTSDGQTIVGLGWLPPGNNANAHAIKWTQAGGSVDLGTTVTGRSTRANDISDDGTKIAGWQDATDGFRQGAIWVNGVQTLIVDADGNAAGEAGAISDDGNWLVGANGFNPYRWSEATGFVTIDHPNAGIFFRGGATAISADGSVVIGFFRDWPGAPFGGEGFIWTEETGRVNLNDYVTSLGIENPDGIIFSLPLGISADGKYIVGTGVIGFTQTAFMIKLPTDEIEGCLETDPASPQWPTSTITPLCNGRDYVIANDCWTGEYSKLQVTEGTEYVFSSSVETDFVTIADENGTEVYAAGIHSVTWTAPSDMIIRFYLHADEDCTFGDQIGRSRIVKCGELPPPPASCDENFVDADSIDGGYFFINQTAIDIPVGDLGYQVYGLELQVGGPVLATMFSMKLYSDNSGLPGEELSSTNATIHSEEFVGSNFGVDFYRYVIVFEEPVNLEANTNYWMEILSDGQGWQSTSLNILGSGLALNDGTGWEIDSTLDFVYKLVCEELSASDINSSEFTYYPNPVKDVLNIKSQKEVQNISVHNMAGQTVMSNLKAVNGQINMSSLSPGVYVFRVTLQGGQVETFKVIKK